MKTGALFYELFQAAPQTFFELLQLTPTCDYTFESITVKTAEKRMDGILVPMDNAQPIYFLEVQAFPDPTIYWRVMREVATYFEQRPDQRNHAWHAVVLWLNQEDDPGLGTLKPLERRPTMRLRSMQLVKLLKKLGETSLVLNVLRPLLAKDEREVRQNVIQWVENVRQAPEVDYQTEERLVMVLSQLIEQKFRTLSYKELTDMIRLTPFDETASFQEAMKEKYVRVLTIQIAEKYSPSPELSRSLADELIQLDTNMLEDLFAQILHIDSVEQLEQWVAEHATLELA